MISYYASPDRIMSDSHLVAPLLQSAHHSIDRAVSELAGKLVSRPIDSYLSYPPGGGLTESEIAALQHLQLSDAAASAFRKVIADACAAAFFRFFGVMDGVADPPRQDDETWFGARFAPVEADTDDRMLHDEFFESY